MAKKKYYAVAAGRTCGIFTDWAATEAQVKGFPGARYMSFASEAEARAWLDEPRYARRAEAKPARNVAAPSPPGPEEIIVHTDGGSIGNPGPGGYGIVIERDGERREISGGFRLTTNNRMEMMAAIVALEALRGSGRRIHLFSDSSYLVNAVDKGWARKWRSNGWNKADGKAAMNRDLWQRLLALLEELEVAFHWLKGHAGHEQNERCDRLAVAMARKPELPADEQYETSLNGAEVGGEQGNL
jgi:ribonuclease HI